MGCRVLTADRLLKATKAVAERLAHLGQALGAEHEQQQDEDEGNVKWIVESEHSISDRYVSLVFCSYGLRPTLDHLSLKCPGGDGRACRRSGANRTRRGRCEVSQIRSAVMTGECVGTWLPPAGSGVTSTCATSRRFPGTSTSPLPCAVTLNRALVGCGEPLPCRSHTS